MTAALFITAKLRAATLAAGHNTRARRPQPDWPALMQSLTTVVAPTLVADSTCSELASMVDAMRATPYGCLK